ncbi:MAG TPA: hypothetical protein VIL44_07805 [Micromonospora sp.]
MTISPSTTQQADGADLQSVATDRATGTGPAMALLSVLYTATTGMSSLHWASP